MLIAEINQKHVLAYFHDDDAQKAAESFNMAGRIMTATETAALLAYKEGEWDYLHINNSNMAGAKSNMFCIGENHKRHDGQFRRDAPDKAHCRLQNPTRDQTAVWRAADCA